MHTLQQSTGRTQVILVSRSGAGFGGMQQLSHDLAKAIQDEKDLQLIQVFTKGKLGMILLLLRVPWVVMCSPKQSRVHVCDLSLSAFVLLKIFRRDLLFTATACGLDVIYQPGWYQWILCNVLPRIDRIACISPATAAHVQQRGVPASRISIIPCGVWREHYEIHGKRYTALLTVGRCIPRKGILWFLQNVYADLLKEIPHLEYWIVGDGKERSEIEKYLRTSSVGSSVKLFGQLSIQKRNELYKKALLFVMPNISQPHETEGFGIVILEAGVHGLPVVAADEGGIPDALASKECGILFPADNAGACKYAVHEALSRSWDSLTIQETVFQVFDWKHLIHRYRHEIFEL